MLTQICFVVTAIVMQNGWLYGDDMANNDIADLVKVQKKNTHTYSNCIISLKQLVIKNL